MNKKVSIVICTYNRADFLKRTLKSLKRLKYDNFEVVIVNGPSTDNTKTVIERFGGNVKYLENPERNLSISRNIGIEASAGDIIAFIDDDAIPDPDWLNDIVSLYTDDSIGGVGGVVYGPGDTHTQFDGGYVDFWGDADVHVKDSNHNDPAGTKYNMMLGTNCTMSKKALEAVGGFDEYYEYYHDESDLCLRVVRAGFKILNHPRAIIHHEFAKSYIRRDTNDGCHLNWFPILKNMVYFAWKNSAGMATDFEREQHCRLIHDRYYTHFTNWCSEKRITEDELREFKQIADRAYEKGLTDAKKGTPLTRKGFSFSTRFERFDKESSSGLLGICLLCKDDIISSIGGTAKYTIELARGFAQDGHDVHVITRGETPGDWMQEGISFHAVNEATADNFPELADYPATNNNLRYSYAASQKISELSRKYSIDIIESVLWDFEGAVSAEKFSDAIPVIIRLQTPLLKVVETQNWQLTDDLKVFSSFEKRMMEHAYGIIPISDHIVETISELYDVDFDRMNVKKVYLGIDSVNAVRNRSGDRIRILFVGRLERRKGIHTVFEIMPDIMEKYSNVEFRFVGNDSVHDEVLNDTYRGYFEKTYKNYKWYDRVSFTGMVSNEQKDQEYADCDIFISPSLYESFGIIFVEAMSAGKPAIGCRTGGMQEIIVDGKTGYTIETENSAELYNDLCRLIEDNNLRESMGRAGKERYDEMFSNPTMIKNTISAYREFISEFRRDHAL